MERGALDSLDLLSPFYSPPLVCSDALVFDLCIRATDCIIAHGAAQFLRERLFEVSDPYSVHVCDICGLFCVAKLNKNEFSCTRCSNTTRVS